MSLDYEAYMESDEWKALRKSHPAPKICIACDSRLKVELHHMYYPPNLECFHRGLANGRAQGYRLDGRCESFTKDVIRVQQRFELTATAGEVLLMGRSK
jgi:hypothetical protein